MARAVTEDRNGCRWTSSDDAILCNCYATKGVSWCSRKLRRSASAIHTRASKLGIEGPSKNASHVKWTPLQRLEIIDAYQKGESVPSIVKRYPFKADVAYKLLREAGIKREKTGKRNRKWSDEDEAKMARLYSEGKNTIEIGEIFKVGPSTINQILRRRKVKLRRGGVRCSKAKYSWVDRNGRACQFRSSWEVLVARILDERGLDWKYEEKTYPLKSLTPRGRHRSYTPDFWVYDKSGALIKVIDVKGRMKPEQMARVKEFELLYPGLPFELWDENFLKSMGLTWAALHVPSVAVSGALFA